MRIYLIGMPGSGKSTLGRRLAKRLQYQFTDLDSLIVAQEGMSISDIFAKQGEDYFRRVERKALEGTQQLDEVIIATGGGAPCFFDNMAWMKSNGLTIWLDISPATIASRMNNDITGKEQRPLFAGKNQEEIVSALAEMHHRRQPFYQQARLCITEKEARSVTVAKKIKDLVG